jgi:hypothetical protein
MQFYDILFCHFASIRGADETGRPQSHPTPSADMVPADRSSMQGLSDCETLFVQNPALAPDNPDEIPADVAEDVGQLEIWMKKAIDVAAKARRGKNKRGKP